MVRRLSGRSKIITINTGIFRLVELSYYWGQDNHHHFLYDNEARETALTLCDRKGGFSDSKVIATVSYQRVVRSRPLENSKGFTFEEFMRMGRGEFISETRFYEKSEAPELETTATS